MWLFTAIVIFVLLPKYKNRNLTWKYHRCFSIDILVSDTLHLYSIMASYTTLSPFATNLCWEEILYVHHHLPLTVVITCLLVTITKDALLLKWKYFIIRNWDFIRLKSFRWNFKMYTQGKTIPRPHFIVQRCKRYFRTTAILYLKNYIKLWANLNGSDKLSYNFRIRE